MTRVFMMLALSLVARSSHAKSMFDASTGELLVYKVDGPAVHGLLCQNVKADELRKFIEEMPTERCQELIAGGLTLPVLTGNLPHLKEIMGRDIDLMVNALTGLSSSIKDPGKAALLMQLSQSLSTQGHAQLDRVTPEIVYQALIDEAQTRSTVVETPTDEFTEEIDKFLSLGPK